MRKDMMEEFIKAVENGWKPAELEDRGCSCHLNAPCSYCCIDDSYFEEWLKEREE